MRSQSHVTSAQSLLKGKIQNWEVLIEKLTRVKVVSHWWVTHLPCISLSTVCFQISPQCTFLIGDRDEIDEKSSINLLDSEIGEVLSATHREATVVGHSFAWLFSSVCFQTSPRFTLLTYPIGEIEATTAPHRERQRWWVTHLPGFSLHCVFSN